MKKSDFRNLDHCSAEYVVLNAKWRLQRGKRTVSLPFLFEKNPLKALELAEQLAYFPINGKYLKGISLDQYVCSKCGASNVKLWRPYGSLCFKLLCAKCACEDQKENISASDIDKDGRRKDVVGGRTDQIGMYIPAVPTEKNDSYWGYTSVPSPAVDWWIKMPTHPIEQSQPSI